LQLSPAALGTFDTVLFLGVVYHVTDIYRHLEVVTSMTRDHLVVETVITLLDDPLPIARFIEDHELGRDPTNFWCPNPALIKQLLIRFGFSRIEMRTNEKSKWWRLQARLRRRRMTRAIFHAWR
jgi:tRNA (mo5U34)-methyltransferase